MGNPKAESNTFAFLGTGKIFVFFKISAVANLPKMFSFSWNGWYLQEDCCFITSNDPNTHINCFLKSLRSLYKR